MAVSSLHACFCIADAPMASNLPKLRQEWNEIASVDALWAINSRSDRKHNKWDLDDFFDTGAEQVRTILNSCTASGLQVTYGDAVDFGCGVGRLTRHLAGTFRSVSGIDISEEMIARARSLNPSLNNVAFFANPHPDLRIIADASCDFLCSIFVLQHMP